ncbi:diphthine--ammonia ligase [Prolixibacteraceae bacterium Z1-6]|uniref:Diphthine--ammonia ligase n=1 Tax=Draconibacterium aestuarii TaxID=2998507 RepID=A0A9X3J4T4_9BACT|nr:diphthine--ammonia ligase [Prolixibacteraceae bacterium Z1-6]
MKAFASWSGGKDCMLALYRFLKDSENTVECLVNMCDTDAVHSRSHGIDKNWIRKQAKQMEIEVIQPVSDFAGYEKVFKHQISILKERNVEAGIFGDIYLKEHKVWIERVCSEMQIQALFPLWGENTEDLLKEFIGEGFKTILVAIRNDVLDNSWLGQVIDTRFLADIKKLDGVDPCAENGEYHSFVFDGPLFSTALDFTTGATITSGNHNFLHLKQND